MVLFTKWALFVSLSLIVPSFAAPILQGHESSLVRRDVSSGNGAADAPSTHDPGRLVPVNGAAADVVSSRLGSGHELNHFVKHHMPEFTPAQVAELNATEDPTALKAKLAQHRHQYLVRVPVSKDLIEQLIKVLGPSDPLIGYAKETRISMRTQDQFRDAMAAHAGNKDEARDALTVIFKRHQEDHSRSHSHSHSHSPNHHTHGSSSQASLGDETPQKKEQTSPPVAPPPFRAGGSSVYRRGVEDAN